MDDYYGTAHLPECFLNAPPGENAIQYQTISTHQQADQELQDLRTASPEKYPLERFGEYNLIVCQTNPENNWRIYIPASLVNQTINWFHQVLLHPGSSRLFATLKQHYYFPNMLQQIEDHANKCEHCIKNKHPSVKYRELPLRKLPTLHFMKWLWIQLDFGKSLSMALNMNSVLSTQSAI